MIIFNKYANNNSTIKIISLVLAFIFAIVYALFPFMWFVLIYDNYKQIVDKNQNYIRRYGTMYEELKIGKGWEYLQFYPVFLLRRLTFVLLLILLEGYSLIQWNIFIVSSFLVSNCILANRCLYIRSLPDRSRRKSTTCW